MNKPAAHLTPTVCVLAANDDDIGRHAKVAQGAMEAHRLFGLIIDLWLYHEKVNIAMTTGLAPGVRAEQDHPGIRSCRSQATTRLGNQSLVNYLHGPIVVSITDRPWEATVPPQAPRGELDAEMRSAIGSQTLGCNQRLSVRIGIDNC
ncbi:MAG: hypothetical protein QOF85_148 [Solirubrobacterales bacterium]|jgi:hypothetical protein|nr:hypothetical protein [Solirubrobacterales bacterium]